MGSISISVLAASIVSKYPSVSLAVILDCASNTACCSGVVALALPTFLATHVDLCSIGLGLPNTPDT